MDFMTAAMQKVQNKNNRLQLLVPLLITPQNPKLNIV